MAVVHQILPNLEYGDAISNYAILLRRILSSLGHDSLIFARFVHPKLRSHAESLSAIHRRGGDPDAIWIYHYSAASELTRTVRDLAGRLLLIYHNVTPPALTAETDARLAAQSFAALEDLKSLADLPRLAVGDSEFNRAQLVELGFRKTDVLPLTLDFASFDKPPRRGVVKKYRDGAVNFLTVSRISPHKKIEDVIKVFRHYHEYINPRSRLFVVGDPKGTERYQEQLLQFCRLVNLPNVLFTGKVRFRELLGHYRIADVYLCMSEHEGFCLPLLESMYLGVPVIAYKCAAVAETMGDAGVLVRQKRFDEVAEMAHLLVSDEDLRTRVIGKQKERAREFGEDRFVERLKAILDRVQTND